MEYDLNLQTDFKRLTFLLFNLHMEIKEMIIFQVVFNFFFNSGLEFPGDFLSKD